MELWMGNMGKEVRELYDEVSHNLNTNTLQVIMQRPSSKDTDAAQFQHDGNGNYKIFINPDVYSDYIFSHQLLHVYIKIKRILPDLISFANDSEEVSPIISKLLSDSIYHKWIINEQRQRGIPGEQKFVDTCIHNINNKKYEETGKVEHDFLMITSLYGFIDDYPECVKYIKETVENRYPFSFSKAKELLEGKWESEVISPFYVRKFITNQIKKWIAMLDNEGLDVDCLKNDIDVIPVFSENQLHSVTGDQFGFDNRGNEYFLFTAVDGQRCSLVFASNPKLINKYKCISTVKTLETLLDEMKITFYLDDRAGHWSRHN